MPTYKPEWVTARPVGRYVVLEMPLCDLYRPILTAHFPEATAGEWADTGKTVGKAVLKPSTPAEGEDLLALLDFLKTYPLVLPSRDLEESLIGAVDEAYVLDRNFTTATSGEYTIVGKLEDAAKHHGDDAAATELARLLAGAIDAHPGLRRADIIMAIPGNPAKGSHLPDLLVRDVRKILGRDETLALTKTAATRPIKDLPLKEKAAALVGAFAVPEVQGRSILLIDDVLQSGTTMHTVARALKDAGARRVMALACVKTWRDSGNRP